MSDKKEENEHSEEHDDGIAHTHSMSNVIETGDEEEVNMILGNRERIRSAGTIRAGVKTLKGTPSADVKKKFDELEAQGMPFDEIDKQLGGTPKSAKSKLRPMNVDHFVIRECDFKNAADAQYIRDNYADEDGQVRRIPIWFSRDEIDKVIPHRFSAFDGGGKVRAASFYQANDMHFRYIEKGVKNPTEEHWKVVMCDDPDEITNLCGHKVQFGGLYRVNVVGLKTFGEVIIPTRSWYGLGDAVAVLRRVKSILGRTKGLVGGKHFLELVKVPEKVRNPQGNMVTQYLITIDAAVDPMILAAHAEGAAGRGVSAIEAFNSGQPSAQPAPAKPAPSSPRPAPVEESPSQDDSEAPASKEDLEKAKTYLVSFCEHCSLDWAAMEAFTYSLYEKPMSEMSKEELKRACTIVRDDVKEDQADFVSVATDLLRRYSEGENTGIDNLDLPFD